MRIFADVFGIPASRSAGRRRREPRRRDLRRGGAGVYPDIETAAARMTKGRESFAPDAANAAVYGRMNETVYQTIRDATDPLLERSYPIFH